MISKLGFIYLSALCALIVQAESNVPLFAWSKDLPAPVGKITKVNIANSQELSTSLAPFWPKSFCQDGSQAVLFQQNVHILDLQNNKNSAVSRLLEENRKNMPSFFDSETVHADPIKVLRELIRSACGRAATDKDLLVLNLPEFGTNDSDVQVMKQTLEEPSTSKKVYLYSGIFNEQKATPSNAKALGSDSNLPLVAQYKFFSPVIFMGLWALVIFIAIIAVGMQWILSIQIPAQMEINRGKMKKA